MGPKVVNSLVEVVLVMYRMELVRALAAVAVAKAMVRLTFAWRVLRFMVVLIPNTRLALPITPRNRTRSVMLPPLKSCGFPVMSAYDSAMFEVTDWIGCTS
uniref:(northern house mosquito) hypothetical protein n=1 Tax=Culex pipiens TaxID=7175 RepID=A0A8D8NUY7_CULPI